MSTQNTNDERQHIRVTHLIDEPPLLVLPTLAVKLGINKAVILQQLHFLLNIQKKAKNKYNHVNDNWWVYNSYQEWREDYFPWLSEVTIKRLFIELENDGIIQSIQGVKNKSDRRKWYTIDYESYENTIVSKCSDQPSDQNDTIIVSKSSDGYSETTSEITDLTVANAPVVAAAEPMQQTQSIKPDEKILAKGEKNIEPAYIAAWLKALPAVPTENTNPYQNKNYRNLARKLHNNGFTPEQVSQFVTEQLAMSWRTVKYIKFSEVCEKLPAWLATRQPAELEVQGSVAAAGYYEWVGRQMGQTE